jgi:putative transposase
VLNMYTFRRLSEVRKLTDIWIREYNEERPHDSLDDLISREYLMANSNQTSSENMGP